LSPSPPLSQSNLPPMQREDVCLIQHQPVFLMHVLHTVYTLSLSRSLSLSLTHTHTHIHSHTHIHKLPLALTHTLVSLCVLMLQQLFRSDDLFPPLTQVTMQGPRDSLSLCLSHTHTHTHTPTHTPHTTPFITQQHLIYKLHHQRR